MRSISGHPTERYGHNKAVELHQETLCDDPPRCHLRSSEYKGPDPEAQLGPLREYAQARGFDIAKEFIDHGVSGAKGSRPALDRMMAAARRRDLDVIVVAKLDRLARSVRHLVNVAEELQALGVDLIVRDQSLDTTTPSGRLLFHVLGSIAGFECDLIRERTQAGLDLARKRGKHVPPYRATKHSTLSELARVLTPQQLQGLARHKKFDTTRIYFGEDADPKAEAQTAREVLLDAQRDAHNKSTTRIDRK